MQWRPCTCSALRSLHAGTGVATDAGPRVSSQQSSAGWGQDTTLADRGSLRSQRTVLHRTTRTDDCSLLTRAVPFLLQPPHFLLEHPAALRVVAEHVEARARRREHDRAARAPPTRTPSARRRACPPASCTATRSPSASRSSGRASPIATTVACRADERRRRDRAKSPPLNRPPRITTTPVVEALDRAPRRFDVGRLRVVDEPHAADLADRFERVLEPGEALDRARHRRRLDAGERRHRRRRQHVGEQVAARAAGSTTAARAARRPSAVRRTIASPSTTTPSSSGRPASRTAAAAPRRRRAIASDARIVGVEHRPVRRPSDSRRSAPWPRRTPRRSRGDRGGRARSSAAPRSTGGTSRSLSSWKLLASTTWIVSAVESSTCALSAWPMLPPTSTRWPPASSIRPVSVVVVDLPFVPVIATIRPRSQRDASSSSPMTGTPARARRLDRPAAATARRAEDDQIGAA